MKRVGYCPNCGNKNYPLGNIFTIEDKEYYDAMINRDRYDLPKSDKVKYCNNCQYPLPFYNRQSKQNKKRQELLDWLLS